MPYRAMFITLITVLLALIAIGMWISAVAPMYAIVKASTQPTTMEVGSATQTVATSPADLETYHKMRDKIKAAILLSFVLICLLLVVGFFATLREWMRVGTGNKGRQKTKYVDAWKLAGERAKAEPAEGGLGGPTELPPNQ